ncbi:MAG: 2-amino-4-hydroxy-6-hydroxymethyldihydropteridine diphosphokinase [Deltaproteobacteria bacterium]|nr:2-amino-4-hydroxy-6-hydroxymethyldihydropteridine diphosphokinase [Deltaproteobacteria bacterium]
MSKTATGHHGQRLRFTAFISIGSNTGDKSFNCRKAIERLSENPAIAVVKKSSFYDTPPWGYKDQPSFVNAAIEITTSLSPGELLENLKTIESGMGRVETLRWGPRVVDLDLIFYNGLIMESETLTLPHPLAHERAFVLAPLLEIAPEFVHPVLKKTVSELLAGLKDVAGCRKI